MYFSRLALFSLPAIAAASVLPRGGGKEGDNGGNTCNIGSTQFCCDNVQDVR